MSGEVISGECEGTPLGLEGYFVYINVHDFAYPIIPNLAIRNE